MPRALPENCRVLTRHALTGEWLSKALPVTDLEYGPELNGPGSLTGTLSPHLVHSNSTLTDPGTTEIYVEEDGLLRWGGLVWDARPQGSQYAIEAASWPSYLMHRIDLDGNLGGRGPYVNADPCQVIRDCWTYAQAVDDGNLNVIVDTTTSTAKIGTTAEPYAFPWWEFPVLGDKIDDIVSGQGMPEYTAITTWDPTKTTPVKRIAVGWPRLGTRRTDISFATGINIIEDPEVPLAGDTYAQVVIANGQGDGSAKRRAISAVRNGRLRLESVIDLTDIAATDVLSARADAERAFTQVLGTVEEITVRDTPSAPIGSWQTGDDVTVRVANDWISWRGWCRITATTIKPTATGGRQAVISLKPSASYVYGTAS
ncbi:hypothetical protein [Streptomyces sp. 8L]|uniref:hypothetical protein n=1 Tax=Streptomyces sp. 8L TaxID=2877242 RepID=UPI001CD32301|nr:hypothetical protein [Streptomyces sp. 8L]MCA1220245.1 hypothetical protein [Streptomyces sp. 8L]